MTPPWPGSPLVFPVRELVVVARTVTMREAIGRIGPSHPVFVVQDRIKVHPVWAMDVIGHVFSEAKTADDVARVRTSLRDLYQSPRPVLDVLADAGFWPGATRRVELEHREVLTFHPNTRTPPATYVQNFAVVSLCSSGKHVRGPWDGPSCPTGLAWNADEPI